MTILSPADIVTAFHQRSLPEPDWTHEAHLIVCRHTLHVMTPPEAVPFLRQAIRSYNEAVGIPNTDDSGYHETLTRYYVGAVATVDGPRLDDLYAAPECSRTAPFRHWSRAVLFSTAARRGWLDPDLEPLPWPAIIVAEVR